ncbi:alpha/beta fold hydrolase [Amycolatopsis sp. H6(2020)]|nr:alpha/beta fold hydrolase [Amycolatopsis sp. H6(2020)]
MSTSAAVDPAAVHLASTRVGSGPRRVLFLHGLFGRGRNFTSIARQLGQECTSLLVDLPDHGASDWVPEISYPLMADAVAAHLRADFAAEGPVDVVGHSMGGKTAMQLALRHPDLVQRLVVMDIAPVQPRDTRGNSAELLDALLGLDLSRLDSRAQADAALRAAIPVEGTRSFLLQNLRRIDQGWAWQPDLRGLRERLPVLMGWPAADADPYQGPVLWITGERSDYVQEEDRPAMAALFPRVRRVVIKGAGHWVHADRPAEVVSALRAFLT